MFDPKYNDIVHGFEDDYELLQRLRGPLHPRR